jgi:hypothetical protein
MGLAVVAKLVWRVKLVAELRPGVTEAEVARIERDGQAGMADLGLRLTETTESRTTTHHNPDKYLASSSDRSRLLSAEQALGLFRWLERHRLIRPRQARRRYR